MEIIKTSGNGINYLSGLLKEKAQVATKAMFWRIPRNSSPEQICLKIGRYVKGEGWNSETLECAAPKSELTLDDVEFHALVKFIQSNYEPLRQGAKRYITIDDSEDGEQIAQLRQVFADKDQKKVLNFIRENNILSDSLLTALESQAKVRAVKEFEGMLSSNLEEKLWQKWFQNNPWVFGSDFVRIIDERAVDTQNIADYLLQAYDGFLDIIEIKRPDGDLRFWAGSQDHGNYYPSSDLTKAITQASSYIYEVEREAGSVKFLEKMGGVKTIKPRCVLIFGRSYDWDEDQREAYRILNAGYHNLSILTYDHVLERAKRILGVSIPVDSRPDEVAIEEEIKLEDIPF